MTKRLVNKRAAHIAAGAAVLALVAGACGSGGPQSSNESSSGDSGTLDVYNWGSADEAKIYDETFAAFSTEHPGVTVNDTVVPVTLWGDYVAKLATQVSAGNSPDLLNMAMEGTRLSQEKGLLEPLDEYLDSGTAAELVEKMPQALKDAYTIDGKLYEIPNGWQTMVMYINTDVFAERGIPIPDEDWTWDEFLEIAKELTFDNTLGFGLPWGFFQLQPWLLTNDAYAVTDDYSAPNLLDPKVVESVTFVRDLVQEHKVAPDPTSVDVYSQFAAGDFAMVGAGRWPIPGWSEAGFTSYKALPWPKQTSHTTVFGGAGWGISPDSANKELAWEAITSLIQPETIEGISDLGQQIPVYPGEGAVPEDKAAADALSILETRIDDAKPVPAPAWYDTLESVFMRHMESIVTGAVSVEDGLAAAQKEIEDSIK